MADFGLRRASLSWGGLAGPNFWSGTLVACEGWFCYFLVSLFGGSEDYRRLSKTIYRDNFGGGCVNVQRGTVDLLSLYLLDCYTFKLASTTALSGFIAASYYLDLFGWGSTWSLKSLFPVLFDLGFAFLSSVNHRRLDTKHRKRTYSALVLLLRFPSSYRQQWSSVRLSIWLSYCRHLWAPDCEQGSTLTKVMTRATSNMQETSRNIEAALHSFHQSCLHTLQWDIDREMVKMKLHWPE